MLQTKNQNRNLAFMYKLRDYQQEAVSRTLHYFRKTRKPAVIVLPTGAGKSLVIAELARLARGRVLVLAHVKELVEQNYEKYVSYGLQAGIFSASLKKKENSPKTIFGNIQSVARAKDDFFDNFSLVIIDECHRVAEEGNTQYQNVLKKIYKKNPNLCVLGLTATPYRLGLGWIYEYSYSGEIKSEQPRFFKNCIFELPLAHMIKNKYLATPIKVDIPVTCYDFSALTDLNRPFTHAEIDEILQSQKNLTPLIIQNIIDITERFSRKGVMIFSGSVKHAEEVMSYLPKEQARIVLGDTEIKERERIVTEFKEQKIKYLVNVSVLTTGFDAPHVDVIAILRPTESNSLYQQIIGRGLRLSPGKKDCIVLDYTGMGHDIYKPEISDNRPFKDTVLVTVTCPQCGFQNQFWGRTDSDGNVYEHYGRKCKAGTPDPNTHEIVPCGYRFRSKLCHACGAENDITSQKCECCKAQLISAAAKLKQARLSKSAYIMQADHVEYNERSDKTGNLYLEIRYYDLDSQYLSEAYFFNNPTAIKKFQINFLRAHLRRPELAPEFNSPSQVIRHQALFRVPAFVIARKQDKYWKVTEKIFAEEL